VSNIPMTDVSDNDLDGYIAWRFERISST